MGNVCSSGQNKKKGSVSEPSDDSNHSSSKIHIDVKKGINYVDQRTETESIPNNGDYLQATTSRNTTENIMNSNKITTYANDSKTLATDITQNKSSTGIETEGNEWKKGYYTNLMMLKGVWNSERHFERHKRIVIYILADKSLEYHKYKRIVYNLKNTLLKRCQNKGFELIISDVHDSDTFSNSNHNVLLDVNRWSKNPLEAQAGHEEAANCLYEIHRHSSSAYLIPILFLGSTLSASMLPITIESQDFSAVLNAATEEERLLLEKFYVVDNCYQPMCHRFNIQQIDKYCTNQNEELNRLLNILLRLFSEDLKDSYISSVVEQEINNTVLISSELAKRCIWIQTDSPPEKLPENASAHDIDAHRRILKLYNELKLHLIEKNLIRLSPNINIVDEDLQQIIENLLSKSITTIIEEYTSKDCLSLNTNGVDHVLFKEIDYIRQYTKILSQNAPCYEAMNDVKKYIKDTTDHPLIIYGPRGCGKSVFVSKIAQNVHKWKPNANLILRYANLTYRSADLLALLGSITCQMSVLANGCQHKVRHILDCYAVTMKQIIEDQKCHFVIIIDSIDDIWDNFNLDWLPTTLGKMCKVILTIEDEDYEGDSTVNQLQKLGVPQKCFIRMKHFTERQWQDILCSNGNEFYATNSAVRMPNEWKTVHGKTPFHAKCLWWLAWLGHTSIIINDASEFANKALQVLETMFSSSHVEVLLLIISLSKWGINESDCTDIFRIIFKLDVQVAFKIWSKFCWLTGSMLTHIGNIRIADKNFQNAILTKYKTKQLFVHKAIRDFYNRQSDYFESANDSVINYNYNKFIKLPYHNFWVIAMENIDKRVEDILLNCFYFTDLQWIIDKVHASGPIHLMNDILLSEKMIEGVKQDYLHISLLKEFLQDNIYELNYDGYQFFTLIKFYLKKRTAADPSIKDDEKICSWIEFTNEIETPFLEIINMNVNSEKQNENELYNYDALVHLPHKGYFVASISTAKEMICIWDVQKCCRVRVLLGIPQPTVIHPFGAYNAAVLCRREIKVINLDDGKFKVTLKGVMNQKMPYFGLHDQKHLVCLSRNRMYVNLMNLESGDCITTFKAGEDRFLNSLLVSGDGRFLVCGDETQKPFPLLVWNLSQRKLLYDLRIPYHDFITSLSAITYEGSYVCVVAKEINEPAPNFIVVYDLQSGTLFKKWKPSCNTVALAISQQNACVIAGLENAKIIIWDLITGNCRWTLYGHNAPVTFLKLDPLGKILLSTDKEGRDSSLRLWELRTGRSLSVLKPPGHVSACEILPNGAYIAVALTNTTELLVLALKNYNDITSNNEDIYIYGNQDNQHKIFNLDLI